VSDPGFGRPTSPSEYRAGYLKYRSVLHDRATGLPAYPLWLDRLRLALDRRKHLGVLQIEILNLEMIESLYGWQVFDRIVRRAADALREAVGRDLPDDTLLAVNEVAGSRLVAFVLQDSDGSDCGVAYLAGASARVRSRVAKAFEEAEFEGLVSELVVRVGRSLLAADPFFRFERRVCAALDEARLFVDRRDRRRELSWGEELERIIRDRSVDSVYQPLVDLQTREVHGYEAFVRGPRDSLFETPRAMFALSSRIGSECRLDRACLESALRHWAPAGRSEPLFVNVLPEALAGGEGTPDSVRSLASSIGRQPGELVLEFSERGAERDVELLIAAMEASGSQGFGVALDDVGTGMHTREIVERARPGYLKLDVSLVRGIDTNLIKRELTTTVVGIAGDYGARVVAEGIESEAEARTLVDAGAVLGQGFLFGGPAEAARAVRNDPS
jgi:EAL domain-containing protein (putative c-di-GMP-specific phosphodiesterase class I)/GGDEF domain-containing protein